MKRALKIAGILVVAFLTLGTSGMTWVMLTAPGVHRLALAPDLVDADSAAGQQALANASAKTDYGQLLPEFVPQSRRAFCGVASSVTVINALAHPQPRLTQKTFSPIRSCSVAC